MEIHDVYIYIGVNIYKLMKSFNSMVNRHRIALLEFSTLAAKTICIPTWPQVPQYSENNLS